MRPPHKNQQRPRLERPAQDEAQLLFGAHIIEELLRVAPFRVERLYLAENNPRLAPFQQLAALAKVPTTLRTNQALDDLAQHGNHQGVVARCGPFRYHSWDDLLAEAKRPSCFLILDSITDPQNLGAMIRSAVWFGIDGIVIPTDRAAPVTPAVIRASAGAALHAKIAQEVNLARVLDQLEDQQIMTIGAVLEPESVTPSALKLTEPCAIVIGAEDKGIRALLRKKCQRLVKIPGGSFESLNAAQAASILLYEVARQRGASPASAPASLPSPLVSNGEEGPRSGG